jgi:hypothetical protein
MATHGGLWERLAVAVGDAAERRRLPVSALRIAEGADEVRFVREALADLKGSGSGPTGDGS